MVVLIGLGIAMRSPRIKISRDHECERDQRPHHGRDENCNARWLSSSSPSFFITGVWQGRMVITDVVMVVTMLVMAIRDV